MALVKTVKVYKSLLRRPNSRRAMDEADLVINREGEIQKDRLGLFVRNPKPHAGEDVSKALELRVSILEAAYKELRDNSGSKYAHIELEARVASLENEDRDEPHHIAGVQYFNVRGFRPGDRVGYRHRNAPKSDSYKWCGVVVPRPHNVRERGNTGEVFVYVMRSLNNATEVFGCYPTNLEKL